MTVEAIAERTGSETVDPYPILGRLDAPCYVVEGPDGIALSNDPPAAGARMLTVAAPLPPERLGSSAFRDAHGVRYAYMSGAMAGGIASADLVIAMARAGCLGSLGAAGLSVDRVEAALERFAAEIPGLPYCVNLIHSPHESAMETALIELLLRRGVGCVEASAFMDLTPALVRYRVAGLSRRPDGGTDIANRVIAKVSRAEVAAKFLEPAPETLVAELLSAGLISGAQAELAATVPMADDITVEADSGGHTDRRPLAVIVPALVAQRDAIQRERRYARQVRVGAAGGLGTPAAVAAAFALGADYVVTGSINQACAESGTSDAVRTLLRAAQVSDCEMAPASDMFELGVDVQVLKRGTMFAMRAKHLYNLYRGYDGIDALPAAERDKLEKQILRRPVEEVWADVVTHFQQRDPAQVERATGDAKRRMALIFRWYLGLASRWASTGAADRVADYQIWCGPSMGAFNEWASGTYLEHDRRAGDVAMHLMRGAAYSARVNQLTLLGVGLPGRLRHYRPEGPIIAGVA
ncbi:PfaD family polyunsaturated fatty acid/polyketide biosynthesis protein [Nocardia pseudobrasiliensis]|uniref:PfaD family protein n=1 Tax=Nocardia pseudobrasiliensis TaxID=45979 RepID=A0A370I5Z0_9NOCA|nr:PfaD family polyunsaturated fatty acid/polyketide biosynthesis protein [Nocardia pseudobrasiliensis]RDI66153.1 PfaD family protein [Nocardia pseudobrasiliensis]